MPAVLVTGSTVTQDSIAVSFLAVSERQPVLTHTYSQRLSRPAVPGSVPRWFTRPKTVTHPSTNRAWRGETASIKTNMLSLSQTGNEIFVENS